MRESKEALSCETPGYLLNTLIVRVLVGTSNKQVGN